MCNGGLRLFFIESRSFEHILEGGGDQYSALESKCEGKIFYVLLGKESAGWLLANLVDLVTYSIQGLFGLKKGIGLPSFSFIVQLAQAKYTLLGPKLKELSHVHVRTHALVI